MLKVKENTQTILAIFSSILWIYLIVISFIGNDFLSLTGLFVSALICVIYFIMGTSVDGKIGLGMPIINPMVITFILWCVSFVIAYNTREGAKLEDFIMGLHPGQFWTIILFWLGTFITLGVSYAKYFDTYIMPEERWNTFLKEVEIAKEKVENEDYID